MARKNRTPEENARREKIRELLQMANIGSLDDIQNAINEIFARHGRAFQTAEIASYFQAKSWYHPDASKTDDQITAEFNEYEKANEKLLENRRDELSSTHGK